MGRDKAEPGRDRARDSDEERLGRAREREKAMVFLDVLVNYGCRRWLHKEDYSFDEDGDKTRSSSKPSQYPLLGFKDRHLEDDYLEHLVVASRARIILAYVTAILLYASGPFATVWMLFDVYVWVQGHYNTLSDDEEKQEQFRTNVGAGYWTYYFPNSVALFYFLYCIVLVMFVFGLVAVMCMYQMKRFEKYRTWILHITPAIYLLYMAQAGFMFTFSNQVAVYGDLSWIFVLIYQVASPLASLFFITLPPLVMLELTTVFVLVFLVIVPLCNPAGNLWNLIDEATDALLQQTDKMSVGLLLSINGITEGRITEKWMYSYSIPIVMLCVLVVCLVVVSVIVDISNRQSFINKKIIEALTKQREETLLQQKEDHENLIHSISPPVVAKDLIRKQSGQDLTVSKSGRDFGLGHMNLGSLVAQMHHEVTILFTDIVGFTSMSQTVTPRQVMEFLHDLFVRFDDLVDMDPSLWKVETIGDAFMIASGLEGVRTKSRALAITNRSSSDSLLSSAGSAILFGKSALAAV